MTDIATMPEVQIMDTHEIQEKKKLVQASMEGLEEEPIEISASAECLVNGIVNGGDHVEENGNSKEIYEIETSDDNDLNMKIKLKRKRIEEVTSELARAEAVYTVFKKVRLSQLSKEEEEKGKTNGSMTESTMSNKLKDTKKTGTITPGNETSTPKRDVITPKISSPKSKGLGNDKIESKFKPIAPAISSNSVGSPTVLSPTPKQARPAPVKKINHVRDLEDIHQLASFLANNPRMSESDKNAAQKLVFRKQLDKILQTCPPPEPEKPDIIFFPSNNYSEFVNLIGLEQVVHHIKAMNAKKKDAKKNNHAYLAHAEDWEVKEKVAPEAPFVCSQCSTDFSPQWFKNSSEQGVTSVFCSNCVSVNRKKSQVKEYTQKLKSTFSLAVKHDKEMQTELKAEYERKVKAYKAEEERKQALANKQILALQRKAEDRQRRMQQEHLASSRKNQQIVQQLEAAQQLAARKQTQQLQTYLAQKRTQRQNQHTASSSTNNQSSQQNNMDVIKQLILQFQKNGMLSPTGQDTQKILALLQTQLIHSGMSSQKDVLQRLQVLMNQHQVEQNRKKQDEEERRRRELETQRKLEEARRKKQAEEAKKKRDTDMAIQQLIGLIAQNNNAEKQQQLLQVLMTQVGNNPEQQKNLVDQVVKIINQQQNRNKKS